jgi:hypothetical protein
MFSAFLLSFWFLEWLQNWKEGATGTIAKGSISSIIIVDSGDVPEVGQLLLLRRSELVVRVTEILNENSFKVHPELTRIPSENDTYEGGVQWSAQ